MNLESARLSFRTLSAADATLEYASWLNDPEVNRFLETRHAVQTPESCREFIQRMNADSASHLFGLFLREGGRHIGNAKLGFINPYYGSADLSLFIGDKTHWGKGIAAEVVHRLTAFGFSQLALDRIQAGCYEDNLASLRVFLKTGYVVEGFSRNSVVLEGRRRGCFRMGILKNDFIRDSP